MNYNIIKRTLLHSIIMTVLCSYYIYACDEGYTYFDELPANVTNLNNSNNCFSNDDISVLNDLISLNNLDNYNSSFELGIQTWVTSRLVSFVATYVPPGGNGITQKITQLPDNIGQISELESLFIEKHDLSGLPDSFTLLTNLVTLGISNNYLISLPEDFGNLTNLETLDLGYNQLESIPESIGALTNLVYLFLFNNHLTSLPETICNLGLNWAGISASNYPYFASGGNYLCDCDLIPDCVENSENANISMEQNYYSWLLNEPQDCSDTSENCFCPNLGDVNCDGLINVLDIVTLATCVLTSACADLQCSCAADINGDGGWNVMDIVTLANCILVSNCAS